MLCSLCCSPAIEWPMLSADSALPDAIMPETPLPMPATPGLLSFDTPETSGVDEEEADEPESLSLSAIETFNGVFLNDTARN